MKLRKPATAGESDVRHRVNIATFHFTVGCVSGRKINPKPCTSDPEVKQKLLVQGLETRSGTAAEFGKFVDDETRKWSALIREAGLKGE